MADRHARFSSLASQLRARGDRPQLRRPFRLHRLHLRHGRESRPALSWKVRRTGRLHAARLRQAAALPLHLERMKRRGLLLAAGALAALPRPALAADPDVAIIGAGVAGLTAARTLMAAGKSVQVI